jgi:hypothetical protein
MRSFLFEIWHVLVVIEANLVPNGLQSGRINPRNEIIIALMKTRSLVGFERISIRRVLAFSSRPRWKLQLTAVSAKE